MANTFFKAQGIPIGASRVEADKLDLARELLALAEQKRDVQFVLPVDALETDEIEPGREHAYDRAAFASRRRARRLAGGRYRPGIDQAFSRTKSRKAKTILWNGPRNF